jgi:chromate transport protein ChrA
MTKSMLPVRGIYRRYYREFVPAMLAYVVIMLFGWPYLRQVDQPVLKAVLALLPVVPIALVIRAMVRLVLGSDELEQRTHLVGLAVSTAVVAVLSLAGGFLAAAHVVDLDGTVLIWVFPVLVLTYSAGRSWANRRYGVDGSCIEETRMREWYFLLAGVVLLLVAWWGSGRIKDYQVGMLTGMGATLVAAAVVFGLMRWRRARHHSAGEGD